MDKKRILNLLTGIQISHLLMTLVDITKVNSLIFQKAEGIPIGDLKIGIIGCGVIGRLIVNGIILLSKCCFVIIQKD